MVVGPKTTLTLERLTRTADGMSGFDESWATVTTISGSLVGATGRENIVRNKVTVTASHRFYCDPVSGVTPTEKDRFKYGSRVFDILYIEKPANTERFWLFMLEEQN